MKEKLKTLAQSVQVYIEEVRRALHMIPETRYETKHTRAGIHNEIKRARSNQLNIANTGIIHEPVETKGGIWVDVDVEGATQRILFRADFDALPVKEATGLPFASLTDGKMHACGHDMHTAMLLGFLKLVAEGKVFPKHNLRLVFQDAEENPGTEPIETSGGEMLVNQGVCYGIYAAYALHIWNNPDGKSGVFFSRPGGMLGNSGRIKFVIKAKGGHVSRPHDGVNGLRAVNAVMNQLNGFVARNFKATQPTTLEPVICRAGTTGTTNSSNTLPGEVELWFGFRTLLPRDEHIAMTGKVVEEARKAIESVGAELAEVKEIYGHPALLNSVLAVEKVTNLLSQAGQSSVQMEPELGGEDFAHYLYKSGGCMWMLGAHTPGTGDHHSPTFNPDESVMWKGVLFWALLATN